MKTITTTLVLAAIAFAAPTTADASIKFCIDHIGLYLDSGQAGEDYWTSTSSVARDARGIYVKVYRDYGFGGNVLVYDDYTGDGLGSGDPGKGCTTAITNAAQADFQIDVYSYGLVQGNVVRAQDSSELVASVTIDLPSVPASSGLVTESVAFSTTAAQGNDLFRVYNAAAYSIWRHAGGMSGETYKLNVGVDCPGNFAGTCTSGGEVYIVSVHFQKKIVIVHEVGHLVMAKAITQNTGNNCGVVVGDSICPEQPAGQSHSMRSYEVQKCAFTEGFAHFYAADVFNDHNEASCGFEYYKKVGPVGNEDPNPAVDCETDDGSTSPLFEVAFMSEQCDDSSSGRLDGYGTELDWLRMFWDLHTDFTPPTFNEILDFIESADTWTNTTVFDVLDDAADLDSNVNTGWDSRSVLNGIDPPSE